MSGVVLIWVVTGILCLISAILTLIGFYKYVYFLSVGYGLSVFGMAIGLIIMSLCDFIPNMGILEYIIIALLILYGLRLAGFLIFREIKSATYKKTILNNQSSDTKKMPIFVKVTIWIMVVLLYFAEISPLVYRILNNNIYKNTNSKLDLILPIIGASIMLIGLILESLADYEKSKAKKKNPKRFVDSGLYKYVRCPNYLGEILFWSGVFISGVNVFNYWWMYVIAILGYLLIVYVMISGAKRLEKRQNKNYGENPEYIEYVKKTPIISRLIPVKSLIKQKWIV